MPLRRRIARRPVARRPVARPRSRAVSPLRRTPIARRATAGSGTARPIVRRAPNPQTGRARAVRRMPAGVKGLGRRPSGSNRGVPLGRRSTTPIQKVRGSQAGRAKAMRSKAQGAVNQRRANPQRRRRY